MNNKVVLASSSVHRRKLLRQLKIRFSYVAPNIDEKKLKSESINAYVKRLSKEKAESVSKRYKNSLIIGSDEVAVVDNKILGKPITIKNAKKQLKFISNKSVIFKTGICVLNSDTNESLSAVVNSKIIMQKLTLKHINYYIKNEDMLNCAASIRIEGMAIGMVKKMYGEDPTSIIGLPLLKVIEFLKYFGYDIFKKY